MTENTGRQPLKVAIAGLGTVGGGVVKLLQANADALALRTGRGIAITAVSDRYRRDRGFSVDGYAWYDDAVVMAAEADAEVIVELIGGADGAEHLRLHLHVPLPQRRGEPRQLGVACRIQV